VIVTTNLRFAEWSSVLGGDERLAAALLDRLTHRAHILEFVGTSFRFREQLSRENLNAGPGLGTADREREEGETSQPSSTETPLSKEKEA
jgi:hypothetical protein